MSFQKIFNEDCLITMQNFVDNNIKIDLVITSPPYNNGRLGKGANGKLDANHRYDVFEENLTNDEYINWSIDIFNHYDKCLSKNACILYNVSYGGENPNLMWLLIGKIIENTSFMVADCITWKKKSALPNDMTSNKLTRICEYVLVFCRKTEYDTFIANKEVSSISKVGQKFYKTKSNFIEARNNDGVCELNKATFSMELVDKLLEMYATPSTIVYDNFCGTGTTLASCKRYNISAYGSEISKNQVEYAENRLQNICKKELKTEINGNIIVQNCII